MLSSEALQRRLLQLDLLMDSIDFVEEFLMVHQRLQQPFAVSIGAHSGLISPSLLRLSKKSVCSVHGFSQIFRCF